MSLHDNMTDLDNNTIKCINSVKYKLFKQIFIIFRTIETQNFLDSQEDFHDRGLPNLSTQSSWSVTLAPFAKEQLLDLSDTSAIDLLNFYVRNNDTSHSGRGYVSSPSEVKWVLVEAASLDPIRFTSRILHSINPTLYTEHIPAVIEGIANHLCFRSGQFTSGNEWKAVEPLPNEINLAKELLKLLERYSLDWLDGDASSKALSACCKLLIDDECVERLSLLLFWIYQIHLNENKQVTSSEDELLIASINSGASHFLLVLCI
jgi:hypothetical protein